MSSTNKNKINIIKEFVKKLPHSSGVYQMFNNQHKCLYVGKAKDLKKRVTNYTIFNKLSYRIKQMISETTTLTHIVTKTEEEALLLECDLIKSLKPKYNILLKDDKTFPYLGLTLEHKFPRLYKIKTKNPLNKHLFGPFANNQMLDELISFIQRTFKLRVCSDNVFNNRIRPCIYYQINRCSAPCVNKISNEEYNISIHESIELLKGNGQHLKKTLVANMEQASKNNNFESAIRYRDRLRMLSKLNLNYSVILPKTIDLDFITILKQDNKTCIQLIVFKKGRSVGLFHFFPQHSEEESKANILSKFLIQYYKNREVPTSIICNLLPADTQIVTKALEILTNKKVNIKLPNKLFKEVSSFANINAQIALEKELLKNNNWLNYFNELEKILNTNINRIEVYDNSHFKGANMLGVMVVANPDGFNTNEYRIFKLKTSYINKEDDYGMLYEVLTRRTKKLKDIPKELWPNLFIIDGGINHLEIAIKLLKDYKLNTHIKVIAVAKGENRTFGKEKIILENKQILDLSHNQDLFKFILKLRDESHRFAITSQRKANLKQSTSSFLDGIPGVGKVKKQAILLHFGSISALKEATPEQIHNNTQIGLKLSKKILEWLS